MAEIKPAEISAILREQLSGFKTEAQLEEVGTVLQIGDGIARIYGLGGVQYGELIEFENGLQGIALNLEEDNVGAVLLGASNNIKEGDTVKRTGRIASVKVGEKMLGRVVDTLGNPIDGKGPIEGELFEMPIERKAPGVIYRQPVNEPLQTGVKAIDAMIPIMKKNPAPTVLIAGETTKSHEGFVNELKEKIQNEGLEDRILFLGKIHYDDEVPKLMRGLSIVAALSTIEGFGLPVLEAMSSGCAVIASKTGAWEDIIEEDVHGKLVPCNDTNSAHEALMNLTSKAHQLEQMGLKGRERIKNHFTIKSEAESLLNLYKNQNKVKQSN